jgi:hypothetical protein
MKKKAMNHGDAPRHGARCNLEASHLPAIHGGGFFDATLTRKTILSATSGTERNSDNVDIFDAGNDYHTDVTVVGGTFEQYQAAQSQAFAHVNAMSAINNPAAST